MAVAAVEVEDLPLSMLPPPVRTMSQGTVGTRATIQTQIMPVTQAWVATITIFQQVILAIMDAWF